MKMRAPADVPSEIRHMMDKDYMTYTVEFFPSKRVPQFNPGWENMREREARSVVRDLVALRVPMIIYRERWNPLKEGPSKAGAFYFNGRSWERY